MQVNLLKFFFFFSGDCLFFSGYMDFPSSVDSHLPVLITGVEPELTEEINSAYVDMCEELGKERLEIV